MDSTAQDGSRPASRFTKSSAVPSSEPLSLTCTQQLPSPRSSASSCIIMVAMDASSIHTSHTEGSAATMTANVAVSSGVVEDGLQSASLLISARSLTGTRRTSFRFLDDGAILPASTISPISSSERGTSV